MPVKRFSIQIWVALILLLYAGTVTACGISEADAPPSAGVRTWLLVKAPTRALPINQPVNVRSRTEDSEAHVSHVELYALELPSGETNILIRSDQAPFDQSSFTASQVFTPKRPGHYVIQVVGYNRQGKESKSNIIGFDVE